jgi:hypothetical protein
LVEVAGGYPIFFQRGSTNNIAPDSGISEAIGYGQTPFARYLAWFDRIFLAIENWAIDFWNKLVNSRSVGLIAHKLNSLN